MGGTSLAGGMEDRCDSNPSRARRLRVPPARDLASSIVFPIALRRALAPLHPQGGKKESIKPAETAGNGVSLDNRFDAVDRRFLALLEYPRGVFAAKLDQSARPSSQIGARCAVVREVMPPAIGPRSRTMTECPDWLSS